MKYFAVKKQMKIGKKVYTPCVSYKVLDQLKATVDKLAETGTVLISENLMVFQNGKQIIPERYVKKVSTKKTTKKENE